VVGCDYVALANSGVQALTPYLPGKPVEELERELGISHIVKLASNENPLGPSEIALDAIKAELPHLTRYPDGNGFVLKQRLTHYYLDKGCAFGVDQITLGNGSNDVLELIARAFVSREDEVIFSEYAFAVYPLVTQALGAKAVVTPAKEWGHDLEAMVSAVTEKTKLIFIANPNNPTGTSFGSEVWERFMRRIPERVIVVLDEAYSEYMAGRDSLNGLSYIRQYPNLVVTRTFSKAFGLASLRVGYAISSVVIADVLNRIRQPFNANSLALVAAVAMLKETDYLRKSREINNAGMEQFIDGLDRLGLFYIPSAGNFVAVDVQCDAMVLFQSLLAQGVIVRPIGNYGMPTFLRVSIGLSLENERFLKALKKVL
jgi:histidinol-phosphate aminotransferase